MKLFFIPLIGFLPAHASTVSLLDLSSQTPDVTSPAGVISNTVVNGVSVDSTQDITFQFEANFKTTNPAGERVLIEFGGGAGVGF